MNNRPVIFTKHKVRFRRYRPIIHPVRHPLTTKTRPSPPGKVQRRIRKQCPRLLTAKFDGIHDKSVAFSKHDPPVRKDFLGHDALVKNEGTIKLLFHSLVVHQTQALARIKQIGAPQRARRDHLARRLTLHKYSIHGRFQR